MIVALTVSVVALVMICIEVGSPGRAWPQVAGWWCRAALLNGFQALMVLVDDERSGSPVAGRCSPASAVCRRSSGRKARQAR